MTELSAEQITEIRAEFRFPAESPSRIAIQALCDTAEALRAERDAAVETRDEANIKLGTLEGETVLERLGLVETTARMHAELETLRGIAKRLADGWQNHWEMQTREYLWFHTEGGEMEPMTSAEVQAIYGKEDDTT